MTTKRALLRLVKRSRAYALLRRGLRDERGIAAVEFAMLLPVMVMMYLGGVEISQAVGADRKVGLVARTVADLVTQAPTVSNSEMTNILDASYAVAAPYPSANLKVVVSSLLIDANGIAKVDWSEARNGSSRPKGQTVSVPSALAMPNSSLVWSEVEYKYQPTIGYVITGTLTLKEQMYMRPRLSQSVTRSTS